MGHGRRWTSFGWNSLWRPWRATSTLISLTWKPSTRFRPPTATPSMYPLSHMKLSVLSGAYFFSQPAPSGVGQEARADYPTHRHRSREEQRQLLLFVFPLKSRETQSHLQEDLMASASSI